MAAAPAPTLGAARLARPATVAVLANLGLSTQLAVLGVCLALGHPAAYVVVLLGRCSRSQRWRFVREVLASRASRASELALVVD